MASDRSVSVLDAVESALHHTVRICFSPFDLKKWFVLGFCAFLAALGEGGPGGGAANFRSNPFLRRREPLPPSFDHVSAWVMGHLTLVVAIGAVVLLLGVAFGALLQWLGSRGQFMFLDGVLRNRGAVTEPWRRFRTLGNSLFLLRFLLGLVGLAAVSAISALCLFIAWPSIRASVFGGRALLAVALFVVLAVPLALVLLMINLVLADFVVPVMARREITVMAGVRAFREELLPGRIGAFLLFYLLKLFLAIAAGVIITLGTCVTCCIAGLPYLSSVVFLPIFVFMRAYSLAFLEQFGDEWHLFSEAPPASATATSPEQPPPPPSGSGTAEPLPHDLSEETQPSLQVPPPGEPQPPPEG
ncbi:MAG: hypothetical protein WBS54_15685 [Acidobacteriota bacterium]